MAGNCYRTPDDAAAQERSLLKDFWAFSKRAVEGRVGKEEKKASFSCETANDFFTLRYSSPAPLAVDAIAWFPSLPVPESPFDMAPIRPRDVRSVLQRKKLSSAPGKDGILNGHLKHLDSTFFLRHSSQKLFCSLPTPGMAGVKASSR